MKKRHLITYLIVMLCFTVNAQEYFRSNLYNFSRVQYNPATTGSEGDVVAYMYAGRRWLNFDGAPKSYMVGVHSGFYDNMGVGLYVNNYKSGLINNNNIYGLYSYKIQIAELHTLRMGIAAGVTRSNLDMDQINVTTYDDPTLKADYFNKTRVNSSFGIQYLYDAFTLDLAMPEFLDKDYNIIRNVFAMASYNFSLNNPEFNVKPSVLYQTHNNELNQVDVNCQVEWREMVWSQVGYCTNENLLFSLGITFDMFRLGYGYEMTLADLSNVSSGSHELMLVLDIGKSHRSFFRRTSDQRHESISSHKHHNSTSQKHHQHQIQKDRRKLRKHKK